MKTCPFCAESIQDAALVCKHCGRELRPSASGTGRPGAAGKPVKTRRIGSPAFLVILGAIVAAVLALRANSGTAQGGPTPWLPRTLGPTTIRVPDQAALAIKAASYWSDTFTVPPGYALCQLTGHIEATAGGQKDIAVLVTTGDEYQNWRNNHAAKVFFSTGRETAVPLNVRMTGSGKYVVVISNAFSLFAAKIVQVQGIQLTCSR